jgi:hypothetical protein
MAQSIESLQLSNSHVSEHASPGLWKVRLALGWTILFAALVGLFAVSWDIQWHTAVGRDRTLTAPHLFILGSITAMGLAALAAVLIETVWARRRPVLASTGTRFAGLFSSSLGAYLVGYGALDSAVGFPLDQYWHTLYGIDIAIWAPFHIMVLAGFCLSCLGVAFMLAEGAQLAAHHGAKGAAHAGYAGLIVAFAILLGACTFFLLNALDMGFVSLGSLAFTVYPLMLGAFGMFVLVAARRALPWRATATSVVAVYLLFGLVSYLLVPQLMTLLLGIEQQHLLPGAPTVSVVAVQWQNWLIIPAVLLDLVVWVAQRRGWSLKLANMVTLVVASIGISLAALLYPLFLSTAQFYSNPVRSVKISGELTKSAGGHALTNMPHTSVVLIVVVSLLLGLLGVCVGNLFGAGIGESMRRKER